MALSISALIVAVAGVGQAVLPEPDVRFALIAGIPANVARMLLLLGSAVYSRYTYRYEHRQETRQRSRQRSRQRLGMLMLQLLEQTGGGAVLDEEGVLTTARSSLPHRSAPSRA